MRTPLDEGAHLRPEYLTINPQGRVPTLLIDGEALTEIPAILAYLARLAPQRRLWPEEQIAEARLFSYMAWLSSTLHIAFAKIWRPARFSHESSVFAEIERKGRSEVREHYVSIETRLSGPFVFGKQLTVADYYTLFFYRWGWRIGLDMSRFTNWTAHTNLLVARPAVTKTLETEGITLFP